MSSVSQLNHNLFIAYLNNAATVGKINCKTGKFTEISKNPNLIKGLPRRLSLSDNCKTVYIDYYWRANKANAIRSYQYGINEQPIIDPNSPLGHISDFNYLSSIYVIGENIVAFFNNEKSLFEAKVRGKVMSNTTSNGDIATMYYDVVDWSIFKNNTVACITKLTQDKFEIEIFPTDKEDAYSYFSVWETTFLSFAYPNVMIVKGGSEVLVYSISENIYYYLILYAPLAMQSSTIQNPYFPEIKGLMDFGEYYIFAKMLFCPDDKPTFKADYYKR